jgi:hypothetical protein
MRGKPETKNLATALGSKLRSELWSKAHCVRGAEQMNWVHQATFGNKAAKYGTSFGRK